MQPCDIAISYEDGFPDFAIDLLREKIDSPNLQFRVEKREPAGPMMGIEWLMIPGMVIFIAKSYFDGFLKEAGKDHYQKLKESLSFFATETMKHPRIEPTIIGSPGKIRKDNPYSMALSIYAEANDGRNFKLLLPKPSQDNDYTKIIYAFLDFLNNFHQGINVISEAGFDEGSRGFDKLILLHFDQKSEKIEWVNYR